MKSVAVIFGGRSAEHDVSIITAHMPIIASLEASGQFDVWPVYISKGGRWYCDKQMNELSFFQKPDYVSRLGKPIDISLYDGLTLKWSGLMGGKSVTIDVAFPAMHGTYGEDGSLMGLLRMANVPFVGCDIFASAAAMDKVLTKQLLEAEKIPTPQYVWFTRAMWAEDADAHRKEIKKLAFPLFVKPVHLGSSIGISKAKTEAELENAIEVALHYDDKILVEQGVLNLIEVTLPIMGNDELRMASVERPLNKAEFFDFKDKYLSGGKKGGGGGVNSEYSEIPAKISERMTAEVKELGVKVYRTLGCAGIARVDFLIDSKAEKVYVIEVNTLPGGLYDHNWRKSGVSNMELVCGLVGLAEERFAAQRRTILTFDSEILTKVSGSKMRQ